MDRAGNPVGIACYPPDDSQGEDNVQDFLGMVGLPVAEFRNNATWAVVKASSGEESYGILLRDPYGDGRIAGAATTPFRSARSVRRTSARCHTGSISRLTSTSGRRP